MATQENKRNVPVSAKSDEMSKPQHRPPMTYGGNGPFRQMREEFDRLFDRFFPSWPGMGISSSRSDYWGLDVDERDDSIVVRAEAPGFEPGDFDLQVRGNQLYLCACHEEKSGEEKTGKAQEPYHWSRQELSRSVTLPADVTADKVEASYRNGVLTITLPKSTPSTSKKIKVHN